MKTSLAIALAVPVIATALLAAEPVSYEAVSRLSIKEVTVFKDGHAFVVHEGRMPVKEGGKITLDHLPSPVIGTFWSYATDADTRVRSVVAAQRQTRVERTALTVRELIEANTGAEAFITESGGQRYLATILGFPTRSSAELAATSPPDADPRLPQKADLVLLKVAEGIKTVALDRIQDVTFKESPKTMAAQEEFRRLLTLNLERDGRASPETAGVGLVYLQKGIRWIPSYRVDLDGKGKAQIQLQATLLNELDDLENATVQLVIGVPSFYFKDTIDPIALQDTAAQLSQFFQSGGRAASRNSVLAANFSNSIMTQTARMGESRDMGERAGDGGGLDLPEGAKNEDLFVFTVKNVTLKKGERMVLPVSAVTVPYEDVFVLDLPFAPPPEMSRNMNSQQQAELARLFSAPKVMHKARLANKSDSPLTTAPALILREGRVVAQGLMTYTAIGASSDLPLTTAVDLQVKKVDSEMKRIPDAIRRNGDSYMRVELKGTVRLTNHRGQPVKLEVTRHVLGAVDSADHDGTVEMSNVFESRDHLPIGDYDSGPYWWNWFSWPWWWHHVNSVGRITWRLDLGKGEQAELGYTWHYLWR